MHWKQNNGLNELHRPVQPIRHVFPFPMRYPPYPHCNNSALKMVMFNSHGQGSALQSSTLVTSPEHGRPPQAGSVLMPLVWPRLPPPHVAEHAPHVPQSANTHACGGGGGGGGGAGSVGSHCSLIWKDNLNITRNLGSVSATRAYYLSQHRQDE